MAPVALGIFLLHARSSTTLVGEDTIFAEGTGHRMVDHLPAEEGRLVVHDRTTARP
jgi:hypothetical protein